MKASIIAFSDKGCYLAEKLDKYYKELEFDSEYERCPKGGLSDWTEKHFKESDILVFVGSCGIAVRAIANHVVSKTNDPAVIVIDELGTYCISLLSGHIGGANEFVRKLSDTFGFIPVITTATDINHVFAVDTWAKGQGLSITNPKRIKYISSALLKGEEKGIYIEGGYEGQLPKGLYLTDKPSDISISYYEIDKEDCLKLVSKNLVLGIGTRKGIDPKIVEEVFERFLEKTKISREAISKVCSIDLKKNEAGIHNLCDKNNYPFETYTSEELNTLTGDFSSSELVKKVTGIDCVCERSSIYGAGIGSRILVKKYADTGVTMALAVKNIDISFESEL